MNKKLRIALTGSVAAAALVMAACGTSDSQAGAQPDEPTIAVETTTTLAAAETAPEPSTAPATAPAQVIAAASPPPASFAEVEDEYRNLGELVFAAGRTTADQVLANDPEGIYSRFDASFAASVSMERIAETLHGFTAQAPLTGRVAERAVRMSPTLLIYVADLEWGDNILTMVAVFNDEGDISGLNFAPQRPLPPDPAAGYESNVAFRLPFEGLWVVGWGGDTETENYHVVSPDQRHAYDLVVWKDGATYTGDGSTNEDYWAYGQRVLAPAAGTVVAAIDGLPDQTPGLTTDGINPAGNHVVIEVADGEYVLIAHMQPSSLTVAEGDVVEAGQEIGLVGNSGNTSEPHIHIHLQDKPVFDPTAAMGLPLEFSDYLADGIVVERGEPVADQVIASNAG